MLTATDLTGEETQEKKNPRFLLLILVLFIMAGIGYMAFLWIFKSEKIVTKVPEQTVVDASAQAWYDEQKKIMEAQMNSQPTLDSSAERMVAVVIDSSTITETRTKESAIPVTVKPEDVAVKPLLTKPKTVIKSNIRKIQLPENIKQTEKKISTPPNFNNKKVEAFFIPRQSNPSSNEIKENRNSKEMKDIVPNNTPITNEELERFMRLFPDKKTYIQFIGYTKPTTEMDAAKKYIVQFLRQNGYSEVNDQWNFWYDHTAIKEVHYGQSGVNGANFYIPSFR
ncbi:hypothetical protein [Sediminibacterium sp.]|uniref:hypothetical protein n=1 Tax=Sediminibacterium sp. TaxID=1917865 RepID=UPI003F6F3C24